MYEPQVLCTELLDEILEEERVLVSMSQVIVRRGVVHIEDSCTSALDYEA